MKKKIFFFLNVAQIRTILSLLAYAPPTLATIFDFELAQKKVVSDPPEVRLNVSNSFFWIFTFFSGLNLIKLKWQN
jgi:hypothetical protein